MAMLSATAVFRDIAPGYPIRPPTEKELSMPVSKEVKATRDFEAGLLRCYQVASLPGQPCAQGLAPCAGPRGAAGVLRLEPSGSLLKQLHVPERTIASSSRAHACHSASTYSMVHTRPSPIAREPGLLTMSGTCEWQACIRQARCSASR